MCLLILLYDVCSMLIFYFFFQAEDGIRDRNVTGVQTCALPISLLAGMTLKDAQRMENNNMAFHVCETEAAVIENRRALADTLSRSEERRVGKECRYGWWT